MTESEIERLRRAVTHGGDIRPVYWMPNPWTARCVVRVGAPPACAPDDEPEPSECAYFANGEYVALYNTELDEFVICQPV